MTQHLVLTLDEITIADAPHVGGKAYNCARLKQAGIAVPDGIVLTTAVMGATDLPELKHWLASLPPNTRLAVRSSAVDEDSAGHSFAGIHETNLNVLPQDVPDAIRSCWASVRSPQARAYRLARNLPMEDPKTAVLIQIMIDAVASGVAFTINPVTEHADELIINSITGLGEALVSGQVNPDEFRIRKIDRQIAATRLAGATPSLTTELVGELTTILLHIERHYKTPQDVEWCYDGSQFWIVQSRPITAVGVVRKPDNDIEWTRANLREVLPDLALPITVFGIADSIGQAQARFYGKLAAPEAKLGKLIDAFNGRLYFNVTQLRHICKITRTPAAVVLRSLGHEGEIDPEDERVGWGSLAETLAAVPDIVRISIGHLTALRTARRQVARIQQDLRRLQGMDFSRLSDQALWTEDRQWRVQFVQDMQLVFILGGVSMYEQMLEKICERVGMSYHRLAHTYLASGEKSVSSQQAFDLLRLAQAAREEDEGIGSPKFRQRFQAFLQEYGHRGLYESDLSMPRYIEDPSPLMFAIRAHVEAQAPPDPEGIISRQNAEAAAAWAEFKNLLSPIQRLIHAPRTRQLLRRIKQFYLWRERVRSEFVRIALPMRMLHLELARRFVERGWIEAQADYFYLTLADIDAVMDGHVPGPSIKGIAARRKEEWAGFAGIEMPLLVRQSQIATLGRRADRQSSHDGTGRDLPGLCVSAGLAEGEVVVMQDPGEFSRMKPGAILVAPATDPSWTPLFTLASGVIVEIGGMLSHASTVAREYGIPALANVRNATSILSDGDRVLLDATNGFVRIIQSKALRRDL